MSTRFNHLMIRLAVMLQMLAGGTRSRVATARGANFIEYALLAVLAIVIFGAFNATLRQSVIDLFTRVTGSDGLGWTG